MVGASECGEGARREDAQRAAQVALLAQRVGAGAGAAGMGDWDEAAGHWRRGAGTVSEAARERVGALYDAAAHVYSAV